MGANRIDGLVHVVMRDGDELVASDLLQMRDPDTRLVAAPEPSEGVGVITGPQQLGLVLPATEHLEGLVVEAPRSPGFISAANEADSLAFAVLEDAKLVMEDRSEEHTSELQSREN